MGITGKLKIIKTIGKLMSALRLACLVFSLLTLSTSSVQADVAEEFEKLKFNTGPSTTEIAGRGTLKFDENYFSLDVSDTNRYLGLIGNLPSTAERYLVSTSNLTWFAVFDYTNAGYVKDDEEIDADELLSALKKNNAAGNEKRRELGIPIMNLVGWSTPPFYNPDTKRLEWGIRLVAEDSTETINYSTRLLGRTGYISANLVADVEGFQQQRSEFNKLLRDFEFNSGERYSEFKEGDKVAEYGLAALVVGGAAAAAMKSKGFIKLLGLGALALLATVGAAFKRLVARQNG